MDVKIKNVTFQNRQHRIAGLHIGPMLHAGEKVAMTLNGPFVSCVFANDPGHTHLVPISGVSDICIETDKESKKK